MERAETAGARNFRVSLTQHLANAEHNKTPTLVTRYGRPAAVLVPYEELILLTGDLAVGLAVGDENLINRGMGALKRITRGPAGGATVCTIRNEATADDS